MASYTYDDYGEAIRRLFVPSFDPSHRQIPLNELVVPKQEISQLQFQSAHLRYPLPQLDTSSMVVYIDGACRDNGSPNARASYGVYFAPGSPHNTQGLLPASLPQTSTRAEIEALAKALEKIMDICSGNFQLSHIIIASDSAFLVDAMSRHIEGWIENDGIGSRGRKIAHYQRLKELHEKLDYMEYSDDGGIVVQFWHVDRSMNEAADALANTALDA